VSSLPKYLQLLNLKRGGLDKSPVNFPREEAFHVLLGLLERIERTQNNKFVETLHKNLGKKIIYFYKKKNGEVQKMLVTITKSPSLLCLSQHFVS
jgi:hypothetical protein